LEHQQEGSFLFSTSGGGGGGGGEYQYMNAEMSVQPVH